MPSARRVLFFTPHLGGAGAERVIAQLLQGLDRAVAQPELALVYRQGAFLDDVPEDVPVHALGARRLATAVPALARVIRARQPDVVFAAGGANVVASLAHRAARSSARLVLSERSALIRDDRSAARNAALNAMKRWTYRRADLLTTVSAGLATQCRDLLRLPAHRVRPVFNPVIDAHLHEAAQAPVDHPWFHDDLPVVIAVGRLAAIKDYPTLIDAFDRLRQRTPCRLFVLGEGSERAAIEEDLRARDLQEHVHLHGFDKNPFRYMARAHLMLHASRAEGLPGVHIQAAACGTPVVSTDCDFGPREVILQSGIDGFLVPVGDAEGLASHAHRLLVDPELHARVQRAAKASVQRFTREQVLGNYERALLEVSP